MGMLDGVKVVSFNHFMLGPLAAQNLGDLGADVIMIEPIGGAYQRNWGGGNTYVGGESVAFLVANRNKRSIALDLKSDRGREIALALVQGADVVMENFRPGVMDRLGVGYQALSAVNPGLIYCAVSGFGQEGPEKDTPSYDGKIQALSGIMSITGHQETGPTRAGFAVCDAIAGMTAAFAVSSALYQRGQTGEGQMLDVAMYDATLSFLSPLVCEHTMTGHEHEQYGNMAISRSPTANLFRVKDGHILLAVNTEKQFAGLLAAIGRPELADDPRFAQRNDRIANQGALREIIEGVFAGADAATWEGRLEAAGAPCARIQSIAEAVRHPQLAHRDVLQTVEGPNGPLTVVGSGFRMAHDGGSVERPPATPGADADEVLSQAGYAAEEIEAFREAGVV